MADVVHRVGIGAGAAIAAATVVAVVVVGAAGGHRPAVAATPPDGDVVTVTGLGIVQGVPDTVTATFDAHVTRSSVQSALDAAASAVQQVVTRLARDGVARRDVATTSLQVSPHYDNHGSVTGYDANETVTAKISPMRGAGRTVSDVAASAGNDVSMDGLTFDITDDSGLLTDARTKAFADAKSRAAQYAGLSGRPLGSVAKISEVVQAEQPVPERYADALAAGASGAPKAAVLRPGEQPVTVTVTVTWRLG
jgi:uncharacterized protein YggE